MGAKAENNEEFSLNSKEKKFCVSLAKKSIENFLRSGISVKLNEGELDDVPKKLREIKACFVTLTINNELRGCIGHLNAVQPLYEDIIENACAAAFFDPRFSPLDEKEFSSLNVEVSILTEPKKVFFKDSADLLKKIVAGRDGLIISKSGHSATFLPSVWDEINSKEEFLSHLCQKAGLMPDEWERGGMEVQRYYSIKTGK